jgi:hypothetical protein
MKDKPIPEKPAGAFVNFCAAKAKKSPSGAAQTPSGATQASKRIAAEKRAEAEHAARQQRELELSITWFEALPESDKKAMKSEYLTGLNSIETGEYKKRGDNYIGFRFFANKKWLDSVA